MRCFLLILATLAIGGCNRATVPAANPAKTPTVASLVPAATDLILGMRAGDHLVAVSNYDQTRKETQSLPGVGDYRTVDWEKLAELKPAVMIVQFRPDKMPAGLEDRAAHYGIRLINVRINRLDDIFATLTQIGDAIGEAPKAQRAAVDLHAQLDRVRARVAGLPRVRTYIAQGDDPLQACGRNSYMDDLLTIAGGENALPAGSESYREIDREQLIALKPEVVLNLLPGASPQALEKARQFWSAAPKTPAMEKGKIFYLTEDYLLWPGINVGNIAEKFAEKLHPAATKSATNPVSFAGQGQDQFNSKLCVDEFASRMCDPRKDGPNTPGATPRVLASDRSRERGALYCQPPSPPPSPAGRGSGVCALPCQFASVLVSAPEIPECL